MAADLTARQFVAAFGEQVAELDALAARGVDRTLITETISMASSAMVPIDSEAATPALVSIKAVDPSKYPYYGEVKLDPPMRLSDALAGDSAVGGEDLLIRVPPKIADKMPAGTRPLLLTPRLLPT